MMVEFSYSGVEIIQAIGVMEIILICWDAESL